MKTHEGFDVFKYIDFLKQQEAETTGALTRAVFDEDFALALELKNDITMYRWLIDDLTKFATIGEHW